MADDERPRRKKKTQKFSQGPIPGMRISFIESEAHRSLDNPRWLRVATDTLVRPDDFVLGVILEGEPYAMPWFVMKNHHILNLTFGTSTYMICLCEACSTGAAFNPVVDGLRLNFDLAGDYNGTFVIMDRETQTYWQPFTAEAIIGPLAGRRLEPLPLVQCTWSEWSALHAGGYVLDGEGESREGHGAGLAPGTFENNNFFRSALHHDERLPPNEMVLGVSGKTAARAYPLVDLWRQSAALNDEIDGKPVVVLSRPNSLMALAFSRELDGRVLSFAAEGEEVHDMETDSSWNIWGQAIAGPLAGASLRFTRSYIEEWYAWATTHAGTGIWTADQSDA